MGLLTDSFRKNEKALSLRDLLGDGYGYQSSSGVPVTPLKALEVSTFLACVRVIANGIAQVPFKLMRQSEDGKQRLPAKDHPLYKILSLKPNDFQTSFELLEMMAIHMLVCGNAFCFVNRSNRAGIMELIPFEPGAVTVERDENFVLSYKVQGKNGQQVFPAKSIWHVRGPSWDGYSGLEIVKLARESLGLALAMEKSAGSLHKNGVMPTGVYSIEGELEEDGFKFLRNWIKANYSGEENRGQPLILDRNAKWFQTQMSSIDAQTEAMRRLQVEEICRFALVNPIMIGAESKNTTYASAEQMFLAHVVHCLSPHYVRLERSADTQLLLDREREEGYYTQFVDAGLLRGSVETQKDVILGYVNGGVMTPNEGRALLDLNPDPDEGSNKLRVPANITGEPGQSGKQL